MRAIKNYRPLADEVWAGRVDDRSDYDSFRWHQVVERIDLADRLPDRVEGEGRGFCFLGFCCDAGVERNLGRAGTARAPSSIRKEMSNLPCRFVRGTKLFDAGDVHCPDGDLETAQQDLRAAVSRLLSQGLFPIVLGGGHEIALGHYNGIRDHLSGRAEPGRSSLGIINFDAHFDLRPYDNGANSGTMFAQIADQCAQEGLDFSYFCLGIQKYGNTVRLFRTAEELGVQYALAKDMTDASLPGIYDRLDRFVEQHDTLYLTMCADVFSSAYAPGVSAPQPFGLHPEIALALMKHILKSGKVVSFDLAEVSPRFDEDNITSRLAAVVVFALVTTLLDS